MLGLSGFELSCRWVPLITVLDFNKLDRTKTNIKSNDYSGLPFEIQFLKGIT